MVQDVFSPSKIPKRFQITKFQISPNENRLVEVWQHSLTSKHTTFGTLVDFKCHHFSKTKKEGGSEGGVIPLHHGNSKTQSSMGFGSIWPIASIAFRWTHILPTDGKRNVWSSKPPSNGLYQLARRVSFLYPKGHLCGNSSTFMTRTSLIFYWQPWRTIQKCFLDNVPFVHSDPNSIPCIASRTWI